MPGRLHDQEEDGQSYLHPDEQLPEHVVPPFAVQLQQPTFMLANVRDSYGTIWLYLGSNFINSCWTFDSEAPFLLPMVLSAKIHDVLYAK